MSQKHQVLRRMVPSEIRTLLPGQAIQGVRRRAKYLLDTAIGSALLHLGMPGSLRMLPGDTSVRAYRRSRGRGCSTLVKTFLMDQDNASWPRSNDGD